MNPSLNVAFVPSSRSYDNGYIFTDIGRDRSFEPFHQLKIKAKDFGISIDTYDRFLPSKIDVILLTRMDINFEIYLTIVRNNPNVRVVYLATEERVICPFHDPDLYNSGLFDLSLSFDDHAVNDINIFKYFYPVPNREYSGELDFKDRFPVCFVNSNRRITNNKSSLYPKREYFAKFLAKKGILDVYGPGWETDDFFGWHDSYKGLCSSKVDTLRNYKFSLCLENQDFEYGAVSEKIFDCLVAGSVPLYLGAPNIGEYVDADCFVDLRKFSTISDLYDYILSCTEEDWLAKQNAIKLYLKSQKYKNFTADCFADLLISSIQKTSQNDIRRTATSCKLTQASLILKSPTKYFFRKRLLFNTLFG